MTGGLKLYPAYKDSGVPWLGRVPEHWDVWRLKTLFREVDDRTQTGTETLLSLRMHRGLVGHLAAGGRPIPEEALVGYKRTRPGEIVMNRMRAASGLFAATTQSGVVSPDYAVLKARRELSLDYYVDLFRTPLMASEFRRESKGLGTGESGFLRLYTDRFGMVRVPCPPQTEQVAAVHFLDHVDRRIRRYIRAKQKLITLLNEQKQAIIHRAVTRGLDPTVRLKPSGVEWLGDVPEHWEVWQVGHFARVGNGSTPSRGNTAFWREGTYPWLNSSCVNRSPITRADQFVTALALRECHLPTVRPGSVLLAITGQGKTRGTAALLEVDATINQHIVYVTPDRLVATGEYLQLAFTGAYRELRRISEDSGSTKGALTCGDIRHFRIAVPTPDEQVRVLADARRATEGIEAAVGGALQAIDLLREYRIRLITDLVTGKLDVREAATRLPQDEIGEPAPLDAGDACGAADEEAEDVGGTGTDVTDDAVEA